MDEKTILARDILEEVTVDVEQIAATLGLLLEPMYENDEDGDRLRPALTLLWKNLLDAGSRMNRACDCLSHLDKVVAA